MSLRLISQEASRCERAGAGSFSFAMLDLDHFKKINDTWGYDTGDLLLAAAARACRACLRTQDTLFRLGSEEFGIIFVDTPLAQAAEAAERIRAHLAAQTIDAAGTAIAVTASIGVAEFKSDDFTPPALIARADKALYEAKKLGRNRVETAV